MSWLFTSGGQSIGSSASVLPMNISFRTDWFPLGLTDLILLSKGLSRVFSTIAQKHQSLVLSLLDGPTLTSIMPGNHFSRFASRSYLNWEESRKKQKFLKAWMWVVSLAGCVVLMEGLLWFQFSHLWNGMVVTSSRTVGKESIKDTCKDSAATREGVLVLGLLAGL